MSIQHVAIIGRGALGLLYGDLIASALGPDAVTYVMDPARLQRHAHETPLVNGRPCRIRCATPEAVGTVDLVLLTVKATGLDAALDTMAPVVGTETRIVSLLNGITSEERIAARFGWAGTVISVAQGMDAVFIDGALTYSHPGEIIFGAAPGTSPAAVADIDAFFTRAGIVHTVATDIRHRLWAKLMLNVGINQTCMAYGGTYGSASEAGSEQNRSFIAAMREVIAVAHAEGIELTEADLTGMAELIASLDPAGMPSMAQDRINKRPTEVEEFAGTVIRRAEAAHILVPQNRFLYDQIKAIEAAY